eukprot:COSAG01_NODE_45939_length_404_cov_8.357377_1_plen_134_part_11
MTVFYSFLPTTVHTGAPAHDGLGRAALVRRFKRLKPSHKARARACMVHCTLTLFQNTVELTRVFQCSSSPPVVVGLQLHTGAKFNRYTHIITTMGGTNWYKREVKEDSGVQSSNDDESDDESDDEIDFDQAHKA